VAGSETDLGRIVQGTLFGEAALAAEVAALLADEDGQYIAVNDEAVQLTGYSRPELTNAWMGFLAADERSKAIFEHVSRRRHLQGKKLVKRRDGDLVACRYWAIPTRVTGIPYFLLLLWPSQAASPG
jgi:PAS domain S-box-containing protein